MVHSFLPDNSPVTEAQLRQFHAGVKRRSSSLLNEQDVEDLASDILVDAYAAAKRLGYDPMRLAFAMSKNRPRYYSRAKTRKVRELGELDLLVAGDDPDDPEDELVDDTAWTDHRASFEDLLGLNAMLQDLPEHQRHVVELDLAGLTDDEIGQVLDRSVSTVSRRRTAARASIRRQCRHTGSA